MGDVEKYVKCVRETGTNITIGKVYRVDEHIDGSNALYFNDDAGTPRCRPIKSGTHILYEFVERVQNENETSCL